mgnify:CR=1 FL=1
MHEPYFSLLRKNTYRAKTFHNNEDHRFMKLHCQILGKGRPLVILHGLFGSLDNWRSIAKELSKTAQVITVDLRNHGLSPHSSEQTYPSMAADLAELCDDLSLNNIDLIGHSVGGKVAMAFSHYYPNRINKLIVLDIAPKQYQAEHHAIFDGLLAIDLEQYKKRSDVDTVLAKSLPDKAVRQFLLMNLVLNNSRLEWRVNLQALADNYPQLLTAVCLDRKLSLPTLFICGAKSNYILASDTSLIHHHFLNAEIVTMNTGHWVHAESPVVFMTKVREFLGDD